MYLYNVTIIVENDKQKLIRQRIEALLFDHQHAAGSLSLLEMIDSPHKGTTYCVQLRAGGLAEIQAFQQSRLADFQEAIKQEYAEKVLLFDSIMKYLND
ncbi:DUF4286 family protein [Parapedobacter deserti]